MGNSSSAENNSGSPATPPASEQQQMSYMQMAKAGYQQLVNAIIRPPRCQYDENTMMGPKSFPFCGREFQRSDFVIENTRKLKIRCSKWEPIPANRPSEKLPCVIYMHGNSSGRPEALTVISLVLSIGATLLTFDFTGSGQSDGDYVSLGTLL